jgi:hypothetical protein
LERDLAQLSPEWLQARDLALEQRVHPQVGVGDSLMETPSMQSFAAAL